MRHILITGGAGFIGSHVVRLFVNQYPGDQIINLDKLTYAVQDNESKSRYGVLRGLHFQKPPFAQAKLVRVVAGRVLDVAVDIRNDSPTFGRYFSLELSGENKLQLFIPRGFAHGFVVLSDEAVFQYKCDNYYSPAHEGAIRWNDPRLHIDWQLPPDEIILSEKDKNNPLLCDTY